MFAGLMNLAGGSNGSGAEKILGLIMNDGENKLDHLQTELCKCQDMLAKTKDKYQFEDCLPLLNPAANTLGMIHILQIISTQSKYDKGNFILHVTQVITQGSPKQIKVDPKRFAIVCRKFVEICREIGQPMRAIKPMCIAIDKIGLENHLTPQHTLLFLACISSKCYHAAVPYLNNFVYLVDEKITDIKSEDTRLYYYYGGVCYIALKKWKKAIQFFETVVSAPALIASAIMIEGYKKYVLASLIYKGKVKELPKYVNPVVLRAYKQYCVPYDELASSFASHSLDMVVATITQFVEPFNKDKHMGLISQVRASLIQQNILHLPDVYTTITFEGLKEHAGGITPHEIELLLLKLVETNDFDVKIDQRNKYISFEHDAETYDTDETVNYLRDHIHNTIVLHRHLAKVDRSIEKDEKYVQKTIKGDNIPAQTRPDSGSSLRGDFMMDVDGDFEGFSNASSLGFGQFM